METRVICSHFQIDIGILIKPTQRARGSWGFSWGFAGTEASRPVLQQRENDDTLVLGTHCWNNKQNHRSAFYARISFFHVWTLHLEKWSSGWNLLNKKRWGCGKTHRLVAIVGTAGPPSAGAGGFCDEARGDKARKAGWGQIMEDRESG